MELGFGGGISDSGTVAPGNYQGLQLLLGFFYLVFYFPWPHNRPHAKLNHVTSPRGKYAWQDA